MTTMVEAAGARWPLATRERVHHLAPSKIRDIANAGFETKGVLKFWFGESDQPTPGFIKAAGMAALERDDVFYTANLGCRDLRQAISRYLTHLHGESLSIDRVSITSSGVSALMIAMQAIVSPGDRVVVVTPVWPNVAEIPAILGADVVRFGLGPCEKGWRLDLDRLLTAITPETRLLVVNSPGNPTGWTLNASEQRIILDHCRKLGVWILADDVYERLFFREDALAAPSFFQIADADDRLLGANSLSKAWLMTGWRLGWLVAPSALQTDLGKLIEFNTSCAPGFVQAAGRAAIEGGESFVQALRHDLATKRNRLVSRLAAMDGIRAPLPDGGMYVFFQIAGFENSVELAKRLLAEIGVGLAPGAAFGPEGEGWLRWCFASNDAALDEGVERLRAWARKNANRPVN